GCLDEDEPGVRADRRRDVLRSRSVNERGFNTKVREDAPEEAHRPAVDDVGENGVVAGLEEREEERGLGGEPGGERDRGGRIVELAEASLEGGDGGVRGARVGEALVLADGL